MSEKLLIAIIILTVLLLGYEWLTVSQTVASADIVMSTPTKSPTPQPTATLQPTVLLPPDTIQIGTLIISKPLFDVIAPLTSGLVGILTGGLITFLTTKAIESRKWQREISYKFQEERRKAIIIALEWIAPLKQALAGASSISSAFQFGRIDEDRFFERYPNVTSALAKLDPPAHLKVILPGDAYPMSWEIITGLEELKYLSLQGRSNFKICSDLVTTLQAKANELENYLAEEYRRTFS